MPRQGVRGARWVLAAGLAAACGHASAAAPGILEEVVVKGQMLRTEDSAWSATVLRTPEIREQSFIDTDEMFRLVPGMAVRDLQLGGVANSIVIRGFGSGGHGGDLGVVIDGIALNEAMSHADGYVDLNAVTPLEIERFTVLRGPVSAMYGNFNRGGLLNIQTRKGGSYSEADLAVGSFETVDLQAAHGAALGERQQVNLAGRLYRTAGYRPQSESERGNVSGRWAVELTERLQFAVSGRYHRADNDSASYLTMEQFRSDRRGIDPRAQNDGAEKEFMTLRADLNYELTPDLKLLTFAYGTQQDFTRWFSRPVGGSAWRQREETYDRRVEGAGASLNGLFTSMPGDMRYVVGVETLREATEFQFFDGLEQRTRTAPAISDRETRLNSVSAFGELEAQLHPLAQLSLGVRGDRFTGGCEQLGPETGGDPCGALNAASHVSPKIGLRSQVTSRLALRASWAEGFSLPNGFVKYSVGGQPLDETVYRQTEVGLSVAALDSLEVDLAAYRLSSSGEVRTAAPGIYENYGATLRRGLEASLMWKPLEQLQMRAVYGLTDTEVARNGDERLLGLEIPGVPRESVSLDADIKPFGAWTFSLSWRHVGEYPVDALNAIEASSYNLVDAGVAYRASGRWPFRAYARVDNIADRTYVTTTSLIGGELLVAPGAPRTYRAGVQFDF